MQVNSSENILNNVSFLVGDRELIGKVGNVSTKVPFDEEICSFLNDLSTAINKKNLLRLPDLATFAFWIRRASIAKLEEKYNKKDKNYHLGRGVIFHIAPSNVPVNFAYSLVSGLLAGSINIVRVPSKDFEQVGIIARAINETLKKYESLGSYVFLVRYERNKEVNDYFSSVADVRVVWGGDATINELRKSPLGARTSEVVFADRYSLAVIDSDAFMARENYDVVAQDFYNDTYLTDQNACTSPFLIVWTGSKKEEAKKIFWECVHKLVLEKYDFQAIQGVNKLTSELIVAANISDVRVVSMSDNLIVRVKIDRLSADLYRYKENSGFFFEYDCDDIRDITEICNNVKCQTIGYIGDVKDIMAVMNNGIKGVDRIVPIGRMMDFDLLWDGYNLIEKFSRTITMN